MEKNKTIISWALVIFWMSAIFYLSHQPSIESNNLSVGITERIIKTLDSQLSNVHIDVEKFNHIVRKGAHFFAYLILGTLVINAISKNNGSSIKWIMVSIIICFMYAISDEVHQYFIPGRGPAVFDIFIDTFGAATGVLLYQILGKMFHVEH